MLISPLLFGPKPLPSGADEDGRAFDDRHFDALEPEQAAHAIEGRDHRVKAVGLFTQQALRAPDWLGRLDLRHSSGG